MHLSRTAIKRLCAERRLPLGDLLRLAGVSRTAYYSLVRKDSVLPKSIDRLARALDVSSAAFLVDDIAVIARHRELRAQAEDLHHRYPESDKDVLFRTLQNLDLPPVERLRRALTRAPRTRLHR